MQRNLLFAPYQTLLDFHASEHIAVKAVGLCPKEI